MNIENKLNMRKYIIPLICLIVLVGISFQAAPAKDQDFGCCCNLTSRTAQAGSFLPKRECDRGFEFKIVGEEDIIKYIGQDGMCNSICAKEPKEVLVNVTKVCGDTQYKPAPGNVLAVPVRGKRQIRLSWSANCSEFINSFIISRCTFIEGSCISPTKVIATVPPIERTFTDADLELEWATDYKYFIRSKYRFIHGDSKDSQVVSNPGDIECSGKTTDDFFCISEPFYNKFKTYLVEFGYRIDGAEKRIGKAFKSDFETNVYETFNHNFNNAYQCNEENLIAKVGGCDGSKGEVCLAKSNIVTCSVSSECNLDITEPFGMFGDITACEGQKDKPNYCFYDKSFSVRDDCFSCSDAMSCADYRTKGSCERDNCMAGECEWKDVYPIIGSGVCFDKRFDTCTLCRFNGTVGMENFGVHNTIFDGCTVERAIALSNVNNSCYFDKESGESKSCNEATCFDLGSKDCGTTKINLEEDNSIEVRSKDSCKFGVCQLIGSPESGICVKNADGKINNPKSGSIADCDKFKGKSKEACETDMFPPTTDIQPIENSQGMVKGLQIIRFDKINKSLPKQPVKGKDLPIIYCIYQEGENKCKPSNITEADSLSLDNIKVGNNIVPVLKEGKKIIQVLGKDKNYIRFYGEDEYHNLEIIKEREFDTCINCYGPEVINFSVVGAKKVGKTFITNNIRPQMKVEMSENATFITSEIYTESVDTIQRVKLNQNPQGFSDLFGLDLLEGHNLSEGMHYVRLNSQDKMGIYQDEDFKAPVRIDLTPPQAEIFFKYKKQRFELDGSPINISKLELVLEFNEPVNISNISYTEVYFDDYTYEEGIVDIVDIDNKNHMFFSADIKPNDGPHVLTIVAKDYAGNEFVVQKDFSIAVGLPKIMIKRPSFGVSPTPVFDVEVRSLTKTTCMWGFDAEGFGSVSATNNFNEPSKGSFSKSHILKDFGMASQENQEYAFKVQCTDEGGRTSTKTFMLSWDPLDPVMIGPSVFPEEVIQRPFQTLLKVTTARNSFCAYNINRQYQNMSRYQFDHLPYKFPGYLKEGETTHSVTANLSGLGTHNITVACISLAELGPVQGETFVRVKADVPLRINSDTDTVSATEEVILSLTTNKDAQCFWKRDGSTRTFSYGQPRMSHTATDYVPGSGTYDYMFICRTIGANIINGTAESVELPVKVIVDLTPPNMVYVSDNSTLEDPEFSYLSSRLRVNFLGEDNQSGIGKYKVSVRSEDGNDVMNETAFKASKEGKPFFLKGLNLTNMTKYFIEVVAFDKTDLFSEPMPSDGVTVDFSRAPSTCLNGKRDLDETDIDCGNNCPPCADGKFCKKGDDCESGECDPTKNVCVAPSCTDGRKNGKETDVDCGGDCDKKCKQPATCNAGDGCALGCDPVDLDCGAGKSCNAGDGCKASCNPADPDCSSSCIAGDGCVYCIPSDPDCPAGSSCEADGYCIKGCPEVDPDCGSGLTCGAGDGCKSGCATPDPDCAGATCSQGDGCYVDCSPIDPDCKGGECLEGDDCLTKVCLANGQCGPIDTCSNGISDGAEADVDCGGSCTMKCRKDMLCRFDTDCQQGLTCFETNSGIKRCLPPTDDTDGGGARDIFEDRYGFDKYDPKDDSQDTDGDGLINAEEDKYGTDPHNPDTDDDGWTDKEEVDAGTDPNDSSSKPGPRDSDKDGMPDNWEIKYKLDPNDASDAKLDNDDDGLTNLEEYKYYRRSKQDIDPNNADTDDDWWGDKEEINKGTDPTDPDDHPTSIIWIILLILLILAILVAGGYYGYNYYLEQTEKDRKQKENKKRLASFFQNLPKRPAPKPVVKKVVKKKPVKKKPKGFLSLEDIKKEQSNKSKAKKQKQDDAFAKLGSLKKRTTKKTVLKPKPKEDSVALALKKVKSKTSKKSKKKKTVKKVQKQKTSKKSSKKKVNKSNKDSSKKKESKNSNKKTINKSAKKADVNINLNIKAKPTKAKK